MPVNYLEETLKETNKLNVLYVEDNAETRRYTLKMLQNFFSKITIETNGHEGLDAFKDEQFDIVFTDINMPNMDGLEMIRHIRLSNTDIPIIIFSAHDETEYFLKAIKSGVDGYILKPFDYTQVEENILNILKKISTTKDNDNIIDLGYGFEWNITDEKLCKKDVVIQLTKNELSLMRFFTSNKNRIYSAIDIESYLFDDNKVDNARVRNLLARLKKKLNCDLVESIYGVGYRLRS